MELPYLTRELPGIGGALRTEPEDFVVDELPAYPPSGEGDHVFIKIEKRGRTTADAVKLIARALGVAERDVGVAGLKDRHAVTTQWLSLPPPVTPEAARALAFDDVRVLEAARHGHKLRTGHLRGNRFRLRVRGVVPGAAARARAILEQLAAAPGAPNYYGEQRFGREGDNAARGRALVLGEAARSPHEPAPPGDEPPRAAPEGRRASPGRSRDRRRDRLLVSALQSELFNTWLAARVVDGLYRAAIAGDVLHKLGGGLFGCEDPEVDTARLLAGELVPTGPMFGARMRSPAAGTPAAAREDAILAAAGLERAGFSRVRAIAEGTRRDAAIAVADLEVQDGPPETLDVTFRLPAGAYATTVMREIMKPGSRAAGK